jgi:hypothetical protein
MKSTFPGYYRPSADEFKALWDEAIFVFDANVLLGLYTYHESTTNEFLDLLDRISERIWMPHQFAFEYQDNRIKKIKEGCHPSKGVLAQLGVR